MGYNFGSNLSSSKKKLQIVVGEHNWLTSLFTIGIICLIVFIPLTIIIFSLGVELSIIYNKLQYSNVYFPEIITWLFTHLPEWIKLLITDYDSNNTVQMWKKFSEAVLMSGQYLAGSAFLIGRGTFSFAIGFSIMLYLLFFLLKDGSHLVCSILDSLPLSNFIKKHLFEKFVAVTGATVKGTVVLSVIQGTLGGIAFYIINIDSSILWGVLIAFLSLIPIVGSAIIWVPTAIYLFLAKQIWEGFFIIIFFLVIIGVIDNFLRTLLVGKGAKIPDYLIFIATLGGIEKYGINGFIIGPLIAALFITCWDFLSNYNHKDHMSKLSDTD